ncbi:AraC family transcriptional regulator [Bradyrhizobium ontarionense]|uniref:AraC family transcriptional regulator n=1 Tax=Bradyrhizobium ontarionense TaxID=2898149 RepID=A0ABY3RCE1_9BRAD|nr:AraC family transcriptional regulator [Bradyrhizobium sp. A19]UFZ05065.1 AraC family transcriptional regulator [Bradyrhizobium sp. A19]
MAKSLKQLSKLLNFSAEQALRRAGLPTDLLLNEGKGLTPSQTFDLWTAIGVEVDRHDLPLHLARLFAHAPFTPAMFSFSSSPDVRTGFQRLSLFKPLMGPMRIDVTEDAGGLHLAIGSVDPMTPAPAQFVWFEALYLLECMRCYTAEMIRPLKVRLPELKNAGSETIDFLACDPEIGPNASLTIAAEHAGLPLITDNSEAWPAFERQLRKEMEERTGDIPTTIRAKRALHEMLPAGDASIEAMCKRLAMSKRTLQRELKEEGETFQTVLASTRSELARQYLAQDNLSVEEVSYLLAYKEPNSFYRAFHGWTGLTPAEARRMQAH